MKNSETEDIYNEAQAFYEKGEYQEALKLFNEISDSWPDFSVLNYIGCCYIGTEDYKTAESIFKALISKATDWERPYFNLARVYMATGEDSKAYGLLKKAIEINPYEADSYFYMGVYFRVKEQWNEAIDCFLKSAEIDSEDFDVHLNLSTCYMEIGDCERALSEASMALEINPADPDALFNTTKILISMKNYEKAFSILNDKQTSACDDIGLLKNLFLSALKTDHDDVCKEAARKIVAIDKNCLSAKKFLTDIENAVEERIPVHHRYRP